MQNVYNKDTIKQEIEFKERGVTDVLFNVN